MAKKSNITPQAIISEIKNGLFRPVYLLMGEESYFIDLITDHIIEYALSEEDRDFNQTILYGNDVKAEAVVTVSRAFPMTGNRQLVVLKEAQVMRDLDAFNSYMIKPLESTILVINYKNGVLKNKKLITEIEKEGVVYESKKLYDNHLPNFIRDYFQVKNIAIEAKATAMLCDCVGADLSRLCGEMEKLLLSLPQSERTITPALVEENIGISKDFNNFELLNALIKKDILKANQIQHYFEKNSKVNPLIVIISTLFNFFSNLLIYYYVSDRNNDSIVASELQIPIFRVGDFRTASRHYNAFKCLEVVALLRAYDSKSKGVGVSTTTTSEAELLKELLFRILH